MGRLREAEFSVFDRPGISSTQICTDSGPRPRLRRLLMWMEVPMTKFQHEFEDGCFAGRGGLHGEVGKRRTPVWIVAIAPMPPIVRMPAWQLAAVNGNGPPRLEPFRVAEGRLRVRGGSTPTSANQRALDTDSRCETLVGNTASMTMNFNTPPGGSAVGSASDRHWQREQVVRVGESRSPAQSGWSRSPCAQSRSPSRGSGLPRFCTGPTSFGYPYRPSKP